MRLHATDRAARLQVQEDMLALITSRAAAVDTAGKTAGAAPASDKPADAVAPAGPVQTGRAVQEINQAMKALSTRLNFQVDEESGRTVVKVMDGESGEVLRQIPSEAALQIARSLDTLLGRLVDQSA